MPQYSPKYLESYPTISNCSVKASRLYHTIKNVIGHSHFKGHFYHSKLIFTRVKVGKRRKCCILQDLNENFTAFVVGKIFSWDRYINILVESPIVCLTCFLLSKLYPFLCGPTISFSPSEIAGKFTGRRSVYSASGRYFKRCTYRADPRETCFLLGL